MANCESDSDIWDLIFALNYTFTGWTPSYIFFHMPVRWLRMYVYRLTEANEMQKAAAKGKPYVPRSEFTPEKMQQRNERIAVLRAELGDEDI